MSEITSADVAHLATLARIKLSAEEQQEFAGELPKIVEFVEQLRQVKLASAGEQTKTVDLKDLRDDVVASNQLSLTQLEGLAPEWRDGQNVVPAVFGESSDEG